jgi:lipopolysaccharide transport system permease protein
MPAIALTDFFCLRKKFLVYNLILRNLKIKYRKSFFGMFWTILIPAGSALVYYTVFKFILKVNVENYLLLIVSGIIPWTFFASSLLSGLESLVNNYSLLNKVALPPHALVLSEVLTHLLNLILSLPVILAIFIFSRADLSWTIVQLPVLLAGLAILTYGLSLLLAIGFVYLRDLRYLITILMQFWFYLTPIMYKSDMIPADYRFVLALNPVGLIFEGIHKSLIEHQWLSLQEISIISFWVILLPSAGYLAVLKLRTKIIEIL